MHAVRDRSDESPTLMLGKGGTTTPAEMPADIIGGYRIESQIASGGMGAVYRGTHVILPRCAAIKVLHADMLGTQSAIERMLQEARILESIDHPTAVKVYDAGRLPDGRPWVAMELIDGQTLSDHLFVHNRLPAAEAMRILRSLAAALHRAHTGGVVHRDVKPENIMLVAGEHGPDAKLIDWGIAQLVTANKRLTQNDYSPGTPAYMSPEQLRGEPVDGRSDVYALGVVAYEMLTGEPPFDGDSALEIACKTLRDPVPALGNRVAVPRSIELLIAAMLAKKPSERPTLALIEATLAGAENNDEDNDYEAISLELEMDLDSDDEVRGQMCASGEIVC